MRKLGKILLGVFISLILLVVIANLVYDPPPEYDESQKEINADQIAKAANMAKEWIEAGIIYRIDENGTMIVVRSKNWDPLPLHEKEKFLRTWGLGKKAGHEFEGRIGVISNIGTLMGAKPFMYYDVGEDKFIYPEQ